MAITVTLRILLGSELKGKQERLHGIICFLLIRIKYQNKDMFCNWIPPFVVRRSFLDVRVTGIERYDYLSIH